MVDDVNTESRHRWVSNLWLKAQKLDFSNNLSKKSTITRRGNLGLRELFDLEKRSSNASGEEEISVSQSESEVEEVKPHIKKNRHQSPSEASLKDNEISGDKRKSNPRYSETALSAMDSTKAEAPQIDMCLLCKVNLRNGGIIHGFYLHQFCCYGCGKKLFNQNIPCMVCDRSIDRVVRLLPLSEAAEKRIRLKNG